MLCDLFVGADIDLIEIGDQVWTGQYVLLIGRSQIAGNQQLPAAEYLGDFECGFGLDEDLELLGNGVDHQVQMQQVPMTEQFLHGNR